MSTSRPQFGKLLGFWYPLLDRALAIILSISPSTYLPSGNALAVDIYVGMWWLVEITFALVASKATQWRFVLLVFGFVVAYRVIEIAAVLLSILLKGFYVSGRSRLSGNRTTILLILNAIEVMVAFGLLFYFSSILWPVAARTDPVLASVYDAIFFSVVTGTTVGYGVPVPAGPLAKSLAVAEVLFLVFVIIILISHTRSQTTAVRDEEETSDVRPN